MKTFDPRDKMTWVGQQVIDADGDICHVIQVNNLHEITIMLSECRCRIRHKPGLVWTLSDREAERLRLARTFIFKEADILDVLREV